MPTPATVRKWGSNLAVRIPKKFARAHQIKVGSVLDLDLLQVVKPSRRRYKLSELMAQLKPAHRHGEWKLGDPVGKELW